MTSPIRPHRAASQSARARRDRRGRIHDRLRAALGHRLAVTTEHVRRSLKTAPRQPDTRLARQQAHGNRDRCHAEDRRIRNPFAPSSSSCDAVAIALGWTRPIRHRSAVSAYRDAPTLARHDNEKLVAVAAARSLHAARSMPWKYSPPVSIARREDGANGDGAVQPIPPSPDAARQTIFTSRAFDFDSPVLGRRMLSMPSLKWASTLLPSTLSGSEKRREKLP